MMRRTTLSRKTTSLVARLERLERLTGKNSCPKCRLHVRHSLSDPSKPKPGDLPQCIPALCPLCEQANVIDLSDEPADLVEMLRICFGSTLEKQFTDLRAWVAREWYSYRTRAQKLYESNRSLFTIRKQYFAEGILPELKQSYQLPEDDPLQRASPSDLELFDKLKSECQTAQQRKYQRLYAKYGENPFPEFTARIDGIKFPIFAHLYQGEPFADGRLLSEMHNIEEEANLRHKCAEAEKIVLGGVTATTSASLAECEEFALESVATARHRYEAKEEERKRRQEESERRTRLSKENKQATPVMPTAADSPTLNMPPPKIQRQEKSPNTPISQPRPSQLLGRFAAPAGLRYPAIPPKPGKENWRAPFLKTSKPPIRKP